MLILRNFFIFDSDESLSRWQSSRPVMFHYVFPAHTAVIATRNIAFPGKCHQQPDVKHKKNIYGYLADPSLSPSIE